MGENNKNNNLQEHPVTRWFRNAVLGATMADLPAMMTASGWRLNEKGDYVLDLQNDPYVKLLRDNLAAEGTGVMLGEFGIPAVYGLYNLGLRGLGKVGNNWARAKLISREIDNVKQIPTITVDNAYKMTDEDWDLAYELALKLGDSEKLKKLRSLHFQVKSGNNPQIFAHTTPNQFHIFDKKYFGTTTDDGYHGKAFYFGETREATPNMIQKSKKPLGPNKEIPKVSYSGKPKYFYLKGDRRYNMSDPSRDFFQELNKVNFIGNSDSKAFQEIMVGLPELIKSARAITYDDNGNFIPLSKRDDFTNPDVRYFKDKYGREITPTPYPGPDSELMLAVTDSQLAVLRDYFSPDKINQIKRTMNWGDLEISELLDEVLRTIGNGAQVLVKGPKDGFTIIGEHEGKLHGTGADAEASHVVTLNRERIPDLLTAQEAGIHEIGVHGKTASMQAEDFGKGGYSDNVRTMFPRLAEITQKNKELADNLLVLNKRGLFLDLFKNVGDLEKYFVNKELSWKDKWDKFYNNFKYYKYVTKADEKTARAYTGQLFNKVIDPNKKTLNVELLERFYTPESVEVFKKAVLGVAPAASLIPSDKRF